MLNSINNNNAIIIEAFNLNIIRKERR